MFSPISVRRLSGDISNKRPTLIEDEKRTQLFWMGADNMIREGYFYGR